MRWWIVALLIVGACKKKQADPLPEAEPEVALPKMAIVVGPALWSSGDAISVPITIDNNRDRSITWIASTIRLQVGGSDRCSGKGAKDVSVAAGATETHMLDIRCAPGDIDSRGELDTTGTILWSNGGDPKQEAFALPLQIKG